MFSIKNRKSILEEEKNNSISFSMFYHSVVMCVCAYAVLFFDCYRHWHFWEMSIVWKQGSLTLIRGWSPGLVIHSTLHLGNRQVPCHWTLSWPIPSIPSRANFKSFSFMSTDSPEKKRRLCQTPYSERISLLSIGLLQISITQKNPTKTQMTEIYIECKVYKHHVTYLIKILSNVY